VILLAAGAGVLALWLWSRSSKADPAPDLPAKDKQPEEPDNPSTGDPGGGVIGRVPSDPTIPRVPVQPLPGEDKGILVPIRPVPVGYGPSNPLPSTQLTPGFSGYFAVEEGDTLWAIADRLGLGGHNWRKIRDYAANHWAREQCPKWIQSKYYGGEKGIALNKRYFNGVYPGWKADLDLSTTGGEWPVLGWEVA